MAKTLIKRSSKGAINKSKILVFGGRVVGKAVLAEGQELPDGYTAIEDSPGAKIGMRVSSGSVKFPSGKREKWNVLDDAGTVMKCIVVDPDDLPKLRPGERFEE